MADYRIICTRQQPFTQLHNHAHIVRVGTGTTTDHYDNLWTVQEVYAAMNAGDRFYTHGASSGKSALVHKFHCPHCTFDTLRSAADSVQDNNLDNLPNCG
jgi:hypothetical protein